MHKRNYKKPKKDKDQPLVLCLLFNAQRFQKAKENNHTPRAGGSKKLAGFAQCHSPSQSGAFFRAAFGACHERKREGAAVEADQCSLSPMRGQSTPMAEGQRKEATRSGVLRQEVWELHMVCVLLVGPATLSKKVYPSSSHTQVTRERLSNLHSVEDRLPQSGCAVFLGVLCFKLWDFVRSSGPRQQRLWLAEAEPLYSRTVNCHAPASCRGRGKHWSCTANPGEALKSLQDFQLIQSKRTANPCNTSIEATFASNACRFSCFLPAFFLLLLPCFILGLLAFSAAKRLAGAEARAWPLAHFGCPQKNCRTLPLP